MPIQYGAARASISLTADDAFKMQLQSLLGPEMAQKEIYQERERRRFSKG